MSADIKRGYGSMLALLTFGLLALYGGTSWLLILIPAALLTWYAAGSRGFRRSRN